MKVLFVCSGNSNYGIVPFIKRQGESIIKEGVNLEFYTIKGKGIKGYLKSIKPLAKHIKNNNYDIIHAHYGMVGLVCGLTFSGKPIVLSIMGSDAYGRLNINGKRVFSSYFEMLLTQIALLFTSSIIVKSKNIFNLVPYKKKTKILPNGVDFELFKPNSNDLIKNNVLCLCNPKDSRKNFKLVQEAISLLNDKNINLVNPYPIKPDDFPKYLNDSSVFVLSSYNEGSPNVIKEAMACGIPIVSTNVGDVEEVINKTKGCYLVSFTPEDVASKIKIVLQLHKRTTGRNDIKHLDSKIVAKKIIIIYKGILSKQ
jgi:teichuronic acid biosynthesis glycosyltransferase TuaC